MNEPVDTPSVIEAYRKQAQAYDSSGISALNGWRAKAVEALNLRRGDAVVDVGCGTGLNFPLLQDAIGPEGHIIGVDLTDAMLDQARRRAADYGWKNIELVQSDAAKFQFPARVDGIISSFALTFIPDCGAVIRNGCQALAPERSWVVLDMAWPDGWPLWMRRFLLFLPSYGITADVIERRPWEIVWWTMQTHLSETKRKQFWMGFFYLASGRQMAR